MRPRKLRRFLSQFGRKLDRFFSLAADEQTSVEIDRYRIVRVLLHLRAILGDQSIVIGEESAPLSLEITSPNVEIAGMFLHQLLKHHELPLAPHLKRQILIE